MLLFVSTKRVNCVHQYIFLTCAIICLELVLLSSAHAWFPLVEHGRCKQSATTCRTTIGNAGGQYACCDPLSASVLKCTQDNPCQSNYPYKWAKVDLPLNWYLNANNVPGSAAFTNINLATLEKELKKAWDAWSTPTCTSFQHVYKGSTTKILNPRDKTLVIYLPNPNQWAQWGISQHVLAFAQPIADHNGRIVDADIAFNPRPGPYSWGTPKVAKDEIDLADVAAHEIGHSLGFGHAPDPKALMYFSTRGLGPQYTGLTKDEVSAICATYRKSNNCKQSSDCGPCRECKQSKCVHSTKADAKSCKPCSTNADCGTGNVCVETAEGHRCVSPCSQTGCCPEGFTCKDTGPQKLCLPEKGFCPDVTCTSDQECGKDGVCNKQSKRCETKTLDSKYGVCKYTCNSDSECGQDQKCITFVSGQKHCINSCIGDFFCPKGFECRGSGQKNYCLPIDENFCPCLGQTHCAKGKTCTKNICQRSGGGRLFEPCNANAVCQSRFACLKTVNGQRCMQTCTSQKPPPEGTLAGDCSKTKKCGTGLQCTALPGNLFICLKLCNSDRTCSISGSCVQVTNGLYCLCGDQNACNSDEVCYKGPTGGQQSPLGVCIKKTATSQCPPDYECKDFDVSTKVCLPKPIRTHGETCDSFKQCKPGLYCLPSTLTPGLSYCVEDCTKSEQCQLGGQCLSFGNNRLCLCENNTECPLNHQCSAFHHIKGLCECSGDKCKGCGNNKCEASNGEDCSTCPKDCRCKGGTVCKKGKCIGVCGNHVCDPHENCQTCPDCSCKKGEECQLGKCISICGNGVCDPNETCKTCPPDCANSTCEPEKGENCESCPSDCKCGRGERCEKLACRSFCGNGVCSAGENCDNCKKDCSCPKYHNCIKGQCLLPNPVCGNNKCEIDLGEGCLTCKEDCFCTSREICTGNRCKSKDLILNCPSKRFKQLCNQFGKDCREVCDMQGFVDPNDGCGCQVQQEGQVSSRDGTIVMGLLFFLLMFYRRLLSAKK